MDGWIESSSYIMDAVELSVTTVSITAVITSFHLYTSNNTSKLNGALKE